MSETKRKTDELIGQTIAKRYRIISRLGEGGMGVAYRAWDEQAGVPVVIKIPKRIFLEDPKFAERFRREIRLLQGLPHPHIVPIVDVGEHEGLPYVAMRFLPGGSLSNRRLRSENGKVRPNPPGMLHLWLPAVAEALDFIHANGVVHRDVKPANIFFDAFWAAYLGDFGIAKIIEESDVFDKEHTLTATHMGIGTGEYMAPEQFTPKAEIDGRADQYALAVMTYELLAGPRPFTGATAHLIVEVTTNPVPPLQARRSDLPTSLVTAVHRGLAKKPDERFATCSEFARAALCDVQSIDDEPGVARLLCPRCSNVLKLPTNAAGQKGKCPKCQTQMKVADDLGALWLLDEARRQQKALQQSGFPGADPNQDEDGAPASGSIENEVIEAFRPVSTTTPLEKAARREVRKLPPVAIWGGLTAALFAALVIWNLLPGSESRSRPGPKPQPRTYEEKLAKAEATLKADPSDRAANEVLGRHWCFRKDDWSKGLPYFARSNTVGLTSAAEKELEAKKASPRNPGDLIRAAQAWWKIAMITGATDEDSGTAIKKHAVVLYHEAYGSLSSASDISIANRWLDGDPVFRELVENRRPTNVPPSDTQSRWPSDAVVWEKNGHAYKVFSEKLLWPQAKQRCEQMGGHLVTITSPEEQQFVHEVMAKAGIAVDRRPGLDMWREKLWAGGTDEGSEGSWRWLDGSPWGFAPWLPQQPDNDGNFLNICPHYGGGWNDDSEVGFFVSGFICEWPKHRVDSESDAASPKLESKQRTAWVSDLPIASRKSHFFHNRMSWGPIGGELYANTIHIHPEVGSGKSQLVFEIEGKYDELVGAIGILDVAKRVASPQVFRIVGDGKELWKSAPFKQTGKGEDFRVNVSGVKTLELLTDCTGSKFDAHCVWIEPQLIGGSKLPEPVTPLVTSAVLFPCGKEIVPSPAWHADIRDLYEPAKRDDALKRLVAASPYFGADEVKKPVRYVVITPTSQNNAMFLVLCGHGDSRLDPNDPRPTGHLFIFHSTGDRVRYSANVLDAGDLIADIVGDGAGYMCQRVLVGGAGGVTKTQMRLYRLDENLREGRCVVVATYDAAIPMTFHYHREQASGGIAVFESPQKKLATVRYDANQTWTSNNTALRVEGRK